jgi:hypothetical protein
MRNTIAEALWRFSDARMTRRRFLGLAAVGALPIRLRQSSGAALSDAAALVQRFYELGDAYQYEGAWNLLGSRWRAQQALARFTNGYGDTAFVQCRTPGTAVSGDTTSVGIELVSWHNDGAIVGYSGAYVVGPEQGQLAIIGAKVARTAAPAGTPPLCGVADVDFAFGPWQGAAGSREGSIRATNRSGATCVLGGSPRITLTDRTGNVLVSTSEEGSPPEAIILAPGDVAQAPIRFANWCGATGQPGSVRAELPGGPATAPVGDAAEGIAYPPCNGPGQPALLEVKGWTR